MRPTDKARFAGALLATAEVYGREVSAGLAELYFRDLAAYPVEEVLDALTRHRRDPVRGQFFPKPADLIAQLTADNAAQALSAWSEVRTLAANCRAAHSGDPVTEQVVADMGGWMRFGFARERDWPFVQREFIERYEARRKIGPRTAFPPRTTSRERINDGTSL